MKKDKEDTQTFISRMPKSMHKQLRFISMYTGMSMQDIGNYAIEKEIQLFKKQIPALEEMMKAEKPKQEESSTETKEDVIEEEPSVAEFVTQAEPNTEKTSEEIVGEKTSLDTLDAHEERNDN